MKAIGVVAEPEIKEFKLSKADKFMILASDGVWEFISSEVCTPHNHFLPLHVELLFISAILPFFCT